MNASHARPAAILGMVVAALLAAGCSSGVENSSSGSPPRHTPTTTSTETAPSTATTPSTAPVTPSVEPAAAAGSTPRPTTALEDGQHLGHIESVDSARWQVTVDIVQWFTGEDAARAAAEDGADEIPPPNDYWVRNTNPRLRTLSVTPDAVITINTLGALESGNSAKDIAKTFDEFAAVDHLDLGLFWLTVSDGSVTRIAEQYRP